MMRERLAFVATTIFMLPAATAICAPASAQAPTAEATSGAGLQSFRTDAELRAYLRRLIDIAGPIPPPPPPAPPPPPPPPPPGAAAPTSTPAAAPASAPPVPGITNTQIAGVDEGGIVKLAGEHLVILRRGRLFTVSLADRAMRPISTIDAFPPGVNAQYDWYDEMLISGDRVIVVGYSYRRGGTQVSRFRLGADGRLSFEDSYHVRSDDYYSAENYATRLVGTRLYLYTPLDLGYIGEEGEDPLDRLPAIRKWRSGDEFGPFQRLASAQRVYIPRILRNDRQANVDTMHSIYSCDLAAPVLDCEATAVLGSDARTFFVSGNAVYLWVAGAWDHLDESDERPAADALLYRIPLAGGRPSAVRARGAPIDQFSFLPDEARSALHVFAAAYGWGDGMWNSEVTTSQSFALISVPMASFGDGSAEVPLDRYTPLPRPVGVGWSVNNRFVSDHLLYARGTGDQPGDVTVVSLADRSAVRLPLAHGVDRIDAIGPDAVVVGTGQGFLGFTPILLRQGVEAGQLFRLANARQGETRSHAFFFRPDPGDGASGMLGLPVARYVEDAGGAYLGNSAGILFLNRRSGAFSEAGQLNASQVESRSNADGCQASCVDWYGNARPIFIGERLFALLGYELVEGREADGTIGDIGRVDFGPGPLPETRQ